MDLYTTLEPEFLDEIIYRRYDRVSGYLESILDMNQAIEFQGEIVSLASFGLFLPRGVTFELPPKSFPEPKKERSLFD